ncbi:predicted protein [Plenodomus lingam JN3]|uniref:Predicted protein n=1 Tax=Leptosphaeria maculans (strain JN3 / isolate v23.1.3 / race Av1-4-5-6-7-8) TaxID=985895 RepID=E4ZNE5_LEPMJ|nr:predicted protein [Plenodomus lingam JN3]CBX93004.1 predicted protein [Plenodomus lingam JN3]
MCHLLCCISLCFSPFRIFQGLGRRFPSAQPYISSVPAD